MKNGLIIGTIACMVAVILVGSVLAPVINTTTTTTIKVDNDGAVGLRMEKITTGNFTITFDEVDGEFTATNGSDAQVIDDVCIFYADNNVAVWLDDSSVRMVGVDADDKAFSAVLSDSAAITITKSSEGVNITDGTVDKTFPMPSWSFVPKSTGSYGFFTDGTEVNTAGMDTLFVGSFAGVDCYNGINTYDLNIALDKTASENTLSGAKWIGVASDPQTLNPDDLHIIPLEPSINPVDPEPEVGIMSMPNDPTYTDGLWGYDVINVDGVDKAMIVNYTGTINEEGTTHISIPSEVGGYEVYQLGRDAYAYSILPNNVGAITIDIPDTVVKIGKYSFYNVRIVQKNMIIPESVETIGQAAFMNRNTLTGALVIKSENVYLEYQSFYNTRFDTLIVSGSISAESTLGGELTYVKTILDLGNNGISATSDGFNADVVRQDIPALGYLAVAQYNETVRDEGPMAAMFAVIPLIMVIAILMFAVGFAIYRRME